ncbi:MAG: hypothetical protein [Chaetfec virus UA24_2231]|nr:MAG: hypothetical protein [Chaetfec virus UA24_2231]
MKTLQLIFRRVDPALNCDLITFGVLDQDQFVSVSPEQEKAIIDALVLGEYIVRSHFGSAMVVNHQDIPPVLDALRFCSDKGSFHLDFFQNMLILTVDCDENLFVFPKETPKKEE